MAARDLCALRLRWRRRHRLPGRLRRQECVPAGPDRARSPSGHGGRVQAQNRAPTAGRRTPTSSSTRSAPSWRSTSPRRTSTPCSPTGWWRSPSRRSCRPRGTEPDEARPAGRQPVGVRAAARPGDARQPGSGGAAASDRPRPRVPAAEAAAQPAVRRAGDAPTSPIDGAGPRRCQRRDDGDRRRRRPRRRTRVRRRGRRCASSTRRCARRRRSCRSPRVAVAAVGLAVHHLRPRRLSRQAACPTWSNFLTNWTVTPRRVAPAVHRRPHPRGAAGGGGRRCDEAQARLDQTKELAALDARQATPSCAGGGGAGRRARARRSRRSAPTPSPRSATARASPPSSS